MAIDPRILLGLNTESPLTSLTAGIEQGQRIAGNAQKLKASRAAEERVAVKSELEQISDKDVLSSNEILTRIAPLMQSGNQVQALGVIQNSKVLDDNDKQVLSTAIDQGGFEEIVNSLTNNQSLEQKRLELRERELTQRRELVEGEAVRAGKVVREKLSNELGLKAQVAGEVKKATSDVASAGKVIDQSFERIGKIRGNMLTIDRAIGALDRGAETGALDKFLPSITAASRELRQIQSELGLDVIGSVTFGALSQGELNLALETALDTGQQPDVLRDLLVKKKAAQNKLMAYLDKQVQFLDGGGTVAGWLKQNDIQKMDADKARDARLNELRSKAGF